MSSCISCIDTRKGKSLAMISKYVVYEKSKFNLFNKPIITFDVVRYVGLLPKVRSP